MMLENLRFNPAETGHKVVKGEKIPASPEAIQGFREHLSKLGDIYINDAFGVSVRFSGRPSIRFQKGRIISDFRVL